MSEKMLVTQALDERYLLVKKINDKIAKASFVDTIKPNEDKVYAKRIDKAEYAKEAEAAYQQIKDLIRRFQTLCNELPVTILKCPLFFKVVFKQYSINTFCISLWMNLYYLRTCFFLDFTIIRHLFFLLSRISIRYYYNKT